MALQLPGRIRQLKPTVLSCIKQRTRRRSGFDFFSRNQPIPRILIISGMKSMAYNVHNPHISSFNVKSKIGLD
jgi:hypothetical protein